MRGDTMGKGKNGEDGYVLGWVVIMVMVVTILVTAVLAVSSAYYRQNLRVYNQRQAYLTARSVVEMAAADFTGEGSGELRDAILEEVSGELGEKEEKNGDSGSGEQKSPETGPVPVPEITFRLDASMGSCIMYGWYMPEDGSLMLTASAEKKGSREQMTVYLQRGLKNEGEQWTVLGYERGDPGRRTNET